MKKRNLALTIISLFSMICVTACNGGDSNSSSSENKYSDDAIPMLIDKRGKYVLDENVTNKDSSMAYEVFVRSYYDSDNNGIGDLNGVALKIPYIASLGVKTLWLMPIHPAASYHGYDVKDYYAVDPEIGTMEDFDNLVAKAKEYNIDIMLDMVLNHTSNYHHWLDESYKDYKANDTSESSKKDWYIWSEKTGADKHKYKDLYYYGKFGGYMPDLNLKCPSLKQELENVMKFWIEKGVQGYRLDAVIHYVGEALPANNIPVLDWIKDTCCKYDPDFYLVGEAWSPDGQLFIYSKSKCDSFFKFSSSVSGSGSGKFFSLIELLTKGDDFCKEIEYYEAEIKKANPNAYSSYFISNHDMDRASAYFQTEEKAKLASSLLCLMPGMSYIYYGEEIQMLGQRCTSPEDFSDVRRRLPMVWSKDDKTGECDFPEKDRPQLANNDQVELGADDVDKDPYSVLNHYRKVINVRNKYPFIKNAIFKNKTPLLNSDFTKVLAYELSYENEKITVIHNLEGENVELDVSKIGTVIDEEINTAKLIPEINQGKLKLGKYSSVIIK